MTMASEIERKFLVTDVSMLEGRTGVAMRQGYVASGEGFAVRVRVAGDRGFLTLKGPTVGITRSEFEYEIPVGEAAQILSTLCGGGLVEKTRYEIEYAGMVWEVDLFGGDNEGLVVAELELESVEQSFELPPWVGKEVSDDARYLNACLAKHPYREWGDYARGRVKAR